MNNRLARELYKDRHGVYSGMRIQHTVSSRQMMSGFCRSDTLYGLIKTQATATNERNGLDLALDLALDPRLARPLGVTLKCGN